MSNAQRLIPFAFGAVIVLLAANLLAGTRRPAEADVTAGPTDPYVVQIAIGQEELAGNFSPNERLYRLWSDGAVDLWSIYTNLPGDFNTNWHGWVPLDPVLRADLNADGCVDTFDLLILLAEWQRCGPAGT